MNNLTREEFEHTRSGVLMDIQGKKHLLVSFGGIQQGLGIPVFEFFNSIASIDCDKIYLRDFRQAWYQLGVDDTINDPDKLHDFLNDSIKANNYKSVCFLGNSMGGYAAMLFGMMLGIPQVIAFSPQSFIDRWHRLIYFDRRWKKEIDPIHSFETNRPDYFDLRRSLRDHRNTLTKIDLYYSPRHRLDRIHAHRLRTIPNVVLHPIREGGHGVVRTVRDSGELTGLIRSSFTNN